MALNHRKYNYLKRFTFENLKSEEQKFMLEYEIEIENQRKERQEALKLQEEKEPKKPKEKIIINPEVVKNWFNFYYKKLYNIDFLYTAENSSQMELIFLYFARDPKFEMKHNYKLSKGLALIGSVGTGKTTIMKTFEKLGTDFYTKHNSTLFLFKMDSCNKLSIEYQSDQNKRDITNYIHGSRCFDDLGSEKNVFGSQNLMEQILEQRYYEQVSKRNLNIKTHLTTNLDFNGLGERYGDRVQDRLKEQCNFIILNSESFRK